MVRDYVMRMIEQIGALLAAVVRKRDAGLFDEARQDLNAICQQQLGLTLDFVERNSPEEVARVLESAGALRYSRAVLLSELLAHDAQISEAAGRASEAMVARLHAFCLLSESIEMLSRDEQATYRPKLDLLAQSLQVLAANPYVQSKLARYSAASAERPRA